MAGETGLEPATTRFGDEDSTIELLPYGCDMMITEREAFVKIITCLIRTYMWAIFPLDIGANCSMLLIGSVRNRQS